MFRRPQESPILNAKTISNLGVLVTAAPGFPAPHLVIQAVHHSLTMNGNEGWGE